MSDNGKYSINPETEKMILALATDVYALAHQVQEIAARLEDLVHMSMISRNMSARQAEGDGG